VRRAAGGAAGESTDAPSTSATENASYFYGGKMYSESEVRAAALVCGAARAQLVLPEKMKSARAAASAARPRSRAARPQRRAWRRPPAAAGDPRAGGGRGAGHSAREHVHHSSRRERPPARRRARALITCAFAVFIAGSLVPMLAGGGAAAESLGPFTPAAEKTNGRAAMIGFASLLVVEAVRGGVALF